MSNQIIQIDTDQWAAALIKTLEKEHASLLQYAESESCTSIRYEIRTEALGFKNATEIVRKAIQACKPAQPIPTAERLPTVGDGDQYGFLLAFSLASNVWHTVKFYDVKCQEYSHWISYLWLPQPPESDNANNQ